MLQLPTTLNRPNIVGHKFSRVHTNLQPMPHKLFSYETNVGDYFTLCYLIPITSIHMLLSNFLEDLEEHLGS